MNLKKLSVAALAVFTLLSCTKEVEVIKEVPVETEPGNALVSFALDANMMKTRAAHGDLGPTPDENKIYNYGLFIFKSNGMLEATLVGKSEDLETPLEPDASGHLTFKKQQNPDLNWNEDGSAIIISAGVKTFFAIVNAPREYIDNQGSFINNETLTLEELKRITLELDGKLDKIVGAYGSSTNPDPVYFENTVSKNGANRGFMMTNIITTGQSDGFYRERLEETDENDPPATITVSVGRAMAKVSLASELTPLTNISVKDDNQPYGALKVDAYRLINNPNEMNVALDMSSGILTTPYFSNTTVDIDNYFVSNNTSHNTTQESDRYYIPVSTDSGPTFIYTIENANNTPKYGNATIALIKGYFTPLTDTQGDATILDATSNQLNTSLNLYDDFYRIWIKPYTHNGVSLGGEYADEYFTASPDLDAYRTYRISKNQELPASVELEVYEYPKGLCYYYLPLENAKNEGSPYSVQRNSYYKIDIKFVSGAGYPEDPENPGEPGGPDKPGPEVPIEAQTEIKASIQVEKWDEVKQTGNL